MKDNFNPVIDVASHIAVLFIAYIAPLYTFLGIISVLIFLDFITGVEKHRRNKNLKISHGMGVTIDKVTSYLMFIFVIFMLETSLLQVDWGLSKLAVCTIGIRESISIFENLFIITNNTTFLYFSTVLKEKLKVFMKIKVK